MPEDELLDGVLLPISAHERVRCEPLVLAEALGSSVSSSSSSKVVTLARLLRLNRRLTFQEPFEGRLGPVEENEDEREEGTEFDDGAELEVETPLFVRCRRVIIARSICSASS